MEKNYRKYGYIFILPFFVVFLIFGLYPIFYTLYLSFTKYTGYTDPTWVGMFNYKAVFLDKMFWEALFNTVIIWGINIFLQLGLAFLLVMIFSDLKYKVKGLKFFRVVFYLPNLVAATSVALIFSKILDKNYGVLNKFLFDIGFISHSIGWLEKSFLAQLSVSNIQTWMWFGNSFILFIATVQSISKESIEAAVMDGAGRFKILRFITIPLIKPIIIYVGITGLIGGLQLFDIPLLLTDGLGAPDNSLNTVILYLFNHAFRFNNFGYAAAIAYVLFMIIVVISTVFLMVMNKDQVKEFYKNNKGKVTEYLKNRKIKENESW